MNSFVDIYDFFVLISFICYIFLIMNLDRRIMMDNNKKRQVTMYFICLFIILTVVVIGFFIYNGKLNQTFNQIEKENLFAYSQTQTQEVIAKIDNAKSTLQVVAQSLGVDENLSEDAILSILDTARLENESFYMNYYTFDKLNMNLLSDKDKVLINQLATGDTVVSDVEYDESLSPYNFYFGVAVPVKVNQEVVGFVRALLPYDILFNSNQTGFLRDEVGSFIIFSSGESVVDDVNLIGELAEQSKDMDVFKTLREDLKEGVSGVQTVNVANKSICISYSSLPYNNWYIINTVDHNVLKTYSNDLKSLTLLLIVVIAGLVMFLALVFIHLFKIRENRLKRESERFSLLVNFTDTILCKYIFEDDVLLFTPNTIKSLDIKDITIHHFIRDNKMAKVCPAEDVEKIKKLINDASTIKQSQSIDIRIKNKSGRYVWYIVKIEIEFKHQKPINIIAKLSDNTKVKEEIDILKERADYDGLTGLYRYPVIKEKIIEHITQYDLGTLVICDCDKFKEINDTYGHAVGDLCLKALSNVFKRELSKNILIGRYGGDEFIIFIKEEINIDIYLQKLMNSIKEIKILEYPEIKLSCCFGVARMKKEKNYQQLFDEADESLYLSKKLGKAHYIIK